MMMGNGSAVLAMPVYLSLVIICLTFCGAWIFDEFAQLSALSLAMLCAGVLVVVLGIMTLALAQHRRALGDRGTDEAESSSALGGAARRGRGAFLQLPGAAPRTSDHAEHQLIDWSKVVRV